MPIGNLAVLDTSVYIENFRTGRFTLSPLRSPWIVCCSAVVLHELRRGARTALDIRFVTELAKKVRTVTPTERHWVESAEILSRLRTRKGYDPKKVRDLAFDVLIALAARNIGATLVTCNRKDFAEIGKQVSFKAAYW